jgi:hypothetical protein
MPKKKTTIYILIVMAALAAPVWGLDLQEGRYEITSKVEMTGMPMAIPPTTITECLTPQDPVPDQTAEGQPCRIINMETRSNTVTWEMECDQQGQTMKSNGKMVYRGDRFEGTVDTQMGPQAGNMKMVTTVNGKRIGPCQ